MRPGTITTLPPDEVDELARWSAKDTPYCDYLQPQWGLTTSDRQRLVDRISAATTSCVWRVHSRQPVRLQPSARSRPNWVLRCLADINAGLRCDGSQPPVLALYNLYLRGATSQLPPADLVLYFGDRIVSEPLREYLAAQRTEFILCSPYPLRQDAIENEFIYPTMKIWGDPCAFAADLLSALPARQPGKLALRPD